MDMETLDELEQQHYNPRMRRFEEEVEQVMETLRDVLTRDKMLQISKQEVLEELEKFREQGQRQDINHTFQYHPLCSVDSTVRFFVNKFHKRKLEEGEESPPTPDEGVEDDGEDDYYDSVLESAVVLPPSRTCDSQPSRSSP